MLPKVINSPTLYRLWLSGRRLISCHKMATSQAQSILSVAIMELCCQILLWLLDQGAAGADWLGREKTGQIGGGIGRLEEEVDPAAMPQPDPIPSVSSLPIPFFSLDFHQLKSTIFP